MLMPKPHKKALNDIAAEAAKFTGQLEKALKVSEYGALLKLCPCIDQGRVSFFLSNLTLSPNHITLHISTTHTRVGLRAGRESREERVTRVTMKLF